MSHTPTFKTIGDLVWEHVKRDTSSTQDGKELLNLPRSYSGDTNEAANLYLAALNIIRKQSAENDRLTAEVKRLREALQRCVDVMPDFLSGDHPAKTHALSVLNPEEPK